MNPRILFVVSGAYGDLALAVSFVFGQDFSGETAIALRPKPYRLNRDSLPLQTYRFNSAKDIIRATIMWEARIVFLLSGYGLPVEGLTSPSELGRLVKDLRNRNCCVVTSDPFLGSASTVMESEVLDMLPPAEGWVTKLFFSHLARRFTRNLNRASNSLSDVIHLYPGPTDNIPNRSRVQRISFFNPELAKRDPAWEGSGERLKKTGSGRSTEKAWLFIIAPSDVSIQQRKWGVSGFANQLVHMLEQTREAERSPVLLGPSSLIRKVKSVLPTTFEPELMTFCSFTEFSRRLLDAEYTFFWNIFSCSAAFMRLARKLPVIYFNKGHVAQFSNLVYEDGVRCYFGGCEPRQIDHQDFSKAALDEVVSKQKPAVDALLEYWKGSPTPRQVIDRLLEGPAM
jgi:hypothetical protein